MGDLDGVDVYGLPLVPLSGVKVVRSAEWRPSCGQCGRDVEGSEAQGWRHVDDGSPACPQGAARAVARVLAGLLVGGG